LLDQATGRPVASVERILTRKDLVSARTIESHKEQLATQYRHGGPAISVVVHSLTNID